MSKLGIAIKITKEGASQPLVVGNVGDWTSRVIDVRDTLKYVTGHENFDRVVKFISFCEDGCLFTQVRMISGRPGDNVAAWLFIPSNIIISGEEIIDIADKVKEQLFNSRTDSEALEDIVSKDYDNRIYAAKYKSSAKDGGMAYRNVDFYPLIDIMGANRYQSYYSNYKYVFLIDELDGITITDKSSVDDLTHEKIAELCNLIAPSIKSIQDSFGKGVVIAYFSRRQNKYIELSNSILVSKGKEVTLFALKDGFEPQTFKNIVTNVEQECQLPKGRDSLWQKRIVPSMFIVKDDKGNQIDQYTIKINGKILMQEVLLYENECNRVHINVSKPGYETNEGFMNLRRTEDGRRVDYINVILTKEERSYEYDIELENKELGKISFTSRNVINKTTSPIKGYEWQGNYLVPNPMYVLKNRLIGALYGIGGLLFIIIISWLYSNLESSNSFPWIQWHKEIQYQPNNNNPENNNTTVHENDGYATDDNLSKEDDIFKAIEYLDNNDVWEKSKMEGFRCLEGLFSDMNNFNLSSLISEKYSGIKEKSVKFKKIHDAAKNNLNNMWDPTNGGERITYNDEGDYKINIQNYCNWIGQKHASGSSHNSTGGGTSSNGSSSNAGTNTGNNGTPASSSGDF